jgi:hypothetical protein
MPPLHTVLAAVVLVGGFWALCHFMPRQSKQRRPGYLDLRTRFGRGVNHPTFREVRRGMREARRMRRNHY